MIKFFNIKWDKWKSRTVYISLAVLILLYGVYDLESSAKLMELLTKAFEILITGE